MARNTIVGKKRKTPTNKASGRKYTQADLKSNRKNQKKRVELNREARKRGVYGKRWKKGVDLSHTKDGKIVTEKRKTNRARNGQGKRRKLK